MRTRIVRIGNARGIRIPKPILEQTGLRGVVDVCAEANTVVIRSAAKPRAGWAEAFREMARCGDDAHVDDLNASLTVWDEDEWEWR